MKQRAIGILGVVGARPNFMKMAPIANLLKKDRRFRFRLVHTGQHYNSMSDPFFRQLRLPQADYHLKVGSRSAPDQMGLIMTRLAPIIRACEPDLVLVVGDVTSTLAAALTAHKLGVKVGHIEAGLRSFDDSMPEEINRRLTDALSYLCFTHSPEASANLQKERISLSRVHYVGNLMIDTLIHSKKRALHSRILKTLRIEKNNFILLTLHRPSNVDRPSDLRRFANMLERLSSRIPLVFPIHPRTFSNGLTHGLWSAADLNAHIRRPTTRRPGLILLEPLPYLDFLNLEASARLVMSDSGGVQEETTALGTPCLTLRNNTERPITVRMGTNRIVGTDPTNIEREALLALSRPPTKNRRPPLWDGKSARRLLRVLASEL